ncbi:MAG: hypothetical protein IKU56_00400, partial [Clostridia bacterium]|nr:hypothetical protein [Clostridia bacterium]
IPNLHGLIDAINKKESSSQYLADLQEIRKAYVQDVKGNYSINDIEPQNGADVNTQYTQDGAKYSVPPVLEAEETEERQGVVPEYTAQTGMEQFTDEQLREELRRRNPKANPLDIAQLTPEDADTTPELGKSTVRNRKGDGDSAFAGSLQGADIFDDRLKDLTATDDKISRYDRIANEETMEAANKALNEGGAAYAHAWEHKNSNTFTAEDVAVGFILMSRYQAVGDYNNAVIVAEKLREVGTKSGQAVQIFSILSRMTPEGMMAYAKKELSQAWEQMVVGKTNKWIQENQWRSELTDEDNEYILNRTWQAAQLPDGRDKNILLAEIAARIQDKIPPEKGQAYKAWQRTAMLLNPKTQIRNVLGNATMVPAFVTSDFIGTGIDKALGKVTGVRTTSITRLSGKAFKQGLFESWDDFARHINTRNIDADRFEISGRSSKNFNEQHTGFAAGARNNLSKTLNALDRFNSFLLEAGDRSFYQMWFVNSLNSQMKANKITDRSQITADMVETATQEALQRTWQDTNKMTKSVSRVKETMNALSINGYGLGDVMIKFTKTPANLTKAMFDFSPAGFLKALTVNAKKFSSAVRDGSVTPQMQRSFVKSLSNGMTGTILMAIGIALAQAGWITGEKDEDKDVAAFDRYVRGYQPYSVKIGNTSFSYDWIMPIGSSWAMAANYFDGKREGDDKNALQVVRDAISTGGQVLFDQSFMRSIQTLFSEDDILTSIVTGVLSDVSAPIPQALSQAAASFDSVVRNTYEYDDDVQTAWNKIIYRIPGLRQTLAPSVDVMGNEIKQIDNNALRAIVSFFSPMNVGEGYESKAADEIYRLYQATGEAKMIPPQAPNYVELTEGKKRNLSSHEKAEFQKITGKLTSETIDGLIGNKKYADLDDTTKAKMLTKIYEYSKAVAELEVAGKEMDDSEAKLHTVISGGVPLDTFLVIKMTSDADGSNKNGQPDQQELKAALEATDLTKKQKDLIWKYYGANWRYQPYGSKSYY